MNFDPTDDYRDDPDFDLQQIKEASPSIAAGSCGNDVPALSLSRLVAHRRLLVRAIRVPFGPQEDLETALDELLFSAPDTRKAGLPQAGVNLLASSFSGKSTGARDYVAGKMAEERHSMGSSSVVYVKLDTDGTVGSLAADILNGLNVRKPNSLSAERRWERARREVRDRGVDLIIFDEFQRAGRRPTISPIIAGKILDIMDDGDCACAFLGKAEAQNVFNACGDLRNRLDSPVAIPPLRWLVDKKEFMAFADAFDNALVACGAIKFKAGLGEEATAQLLLESSNGLIGQFSRIIETAVMSITRDGHDGITREDLADAVQDWSIGSKRIDYNPFRPPSKAEGKGK